MADILFKCPKCAMALAVDTAAIGQAFACSDCGHSIEVPLPDVMFRCASCKTDLFTPQELTGETLHCPNCQNAVVVPLGEAEYLRKRIKEQEQEELKAPVLQPSLPPVTNTPPIIPAKKTPKLVIKKPSAKPTPTNTLADGILRFACSLCSQRLEAKRDIVDEMIECPKCKSAIRVRTPA